MGKTKFYLAEFLAGSATLVLLLALMLAFPQVPFWGLLTGIGGAFLSNYVAKAYGESAWEGLMVYIAPHLVALVVVFFIGFLL